MSTTPAESGAEGPGQTNRVGLLSECYGEKLDSLNRTLWDLFSKTASEHPDHDAIISMWQPRGDAQPDNIENKIHAKYTRWSYSELYHRTTTLATWLSNQGCRPQDRVAAFLWNSIEWGLVFWSAAKLGLVYAPMDPRLLLADRKFLIESTNPNVVVAQDETEAASLDTLLDSLRSEQQVIRIQCSGSPLPGWSLLQNIFDAAHEMNSGQQQELIVHEPASAAPGDITLIVFSSGTTSRPKGCLHSHSNLIAQMHTYDPNPDPEHVDRWLVHTPSHHIFAVNNALRAFHLGHAVIFPSKSFEMQATLRALVDEQATIMSAVPTLVKALLANPLFPGKEALNLVLVTLGGTIITPEDIRLCREGLGAADAIQAFGMSEGAPVISWCRPDPLLENGYHLGVGKTLPGANIKICLPGTRKVLPRNETGELHIGGSQVISGYLGGVGSHSFYQDATGSWLMTGDQARMDSDGVIYILGRYKDVIIRAGENISPTKLEAAITQISGVSAQVIGVSDELTGQVPVAVVKTTNGATICKKEIIAKCLELGPMFALDGVYLLGELDLESFPMTSLGKIKKEVLRQKVAKLRQQNLKVQLANETDMEKMRALLPKSIQSQRTAAQQTTPEIQANGVNGSYHMPSLADRLALIWDDLIGERPGLDDDIFSFADSITLLRFCDRVLNALDQRLYLQDFVENDTINKQAHLIKQRLQQQGTSLTSEPSPLWVTTFSSPDRNFSKGPSLVANGHEFTGPFPAHGGFGDSRDNTSQVSEAELHAAAAQVALGTGFQDGDIEDVLRINGNYRKFCGGSRPQSYHLRCVYCIGDAFSPAQVSRGIKAGLMTRSLFRAILGRLPDGTPFHIILRSSPQLFDALIETVRATNMEEFEGLTKDGSTESHSSPFMSRFQIISVQQPEVTYLSITYSHSVIDALSILAWHQDLARLIHNPNTSIPPLTPYKPFPELVHLYHSSLLAQQSVEYSVNRLRGISRFRDALWPIQRAPGWLIVDDGCPPDILSTRTTIRNNIWNHQWESHHAKEFHSVPRVARNVTLSGLAWLRHDKRIAPSLVMKAAVAILNITLTKSRYAIFNTVHAARSWPFVPEWMAKVLPPPMSIAGPTVEWSLELCEVPRNETVGGLLKRMTEEQVLLEKHAHAPWEQILEALGGGVEREVAEDASQRQTFIWDVSIGLGMGGGLDPAGEASGKGKVLDVVARYDWPDSGLFWNAFMVDNANLFFIVSWDTAQMNLEEVEGYCDMMVGILRKLVKKDNWDSRIDEVYCL